VGEKRTKPSASEAAEKKVIPPRRERRRITQKQCNRTDPTKSGSRFFASLRKGKERMRTRARKKKGNCSVSFEKGFCWAAEEGVRLKEGGDQGGGGEKLSACERLRRRAFGRKKKIRLQTRCKKNKPTTKDRYLKGQHLPTTGTVSTACKCKKRELGKGFCIRRNLHMWWSENRRTGSGSEKKKEVQSRERIG